MNDEETPHAAAFTWGQALIAFLIVAAVIAALTIAFNWAFELTFIPGAHAETGVAVKEFQASRVFALRRRA